MRVKINLSFLMTVIAICFCASVVAQNTNEYRSTGNGDWNNTATWERFDGVSWVPAVTVPDATADSINILTGHAVTVTDNRDIDDVVLTIGGTLDIASGTVVTYGNAKPSNTLTGPGNLNIIGNGTLSFVNSIIFSNINKDIDVAATLNYSNSNTVITNCNTINNGTLNFIGTFTLSGNNTINNFATGTINFFSLLALNFENNDLAATSSTNFNNLGTFNIGSPGGAGITGSHVGAGAFSNTFLNTNTMHVFSSIAFAPVLQFLNSGTITIEDGATLTLPGAFSNQLNSTVRGGGTLSVGEQFVNQGTFSPGLSPDTLSVDLTIGTPPQPVFSGGSLPIELLSMSGNPGSGWDWLRITGAADISGVSLTATHTGPEFSIGRYIILTATGGVTGQFPAPSIPFGYVIDYSVPNEVALQKITTPLPLTWVRFSAKNINDKILLDWVTANEFNTSHFIVERSSDARNYISIGQVPSAGNTGSNTMYQFTDQLPVVPGTNYYRLNQTDKDGRHSFSTTIRISTGKTNPFSASIASNPAAGSINLVLEGIQDKEDILFELFNSNGSMLHRQHITATGSSMVKRIERPVINAGMYFYRITKTAGGETLGGKLIFQ